MLNTDHQLTVAQQEHATWRERNFPNQTLYQAVLGMMEELGELSHALLKHEQGIRKMDDAWVAREAIIDAHCDLIIFSFGVAEDLGYDLGIELQRTWDEVKQRDWVGDPAEGVA